ncbi:MAG: hypothetical protein CSA35_03690 [Dethiosulfovibrio peptidovorans]|nr:MAG: hypothetical protein CSA35_03690 [Dethiosulfovibrio peptidovorans]
MLWKTKEKSKSRAGLTLMAGGLYYLELEAQGRFPSVVQYQFVSYPKPAMNQESLVDVSAAVDAIKELSGRIGGFSCPVALGIPSRDVMMRNIEMPAMELAMAKEALFWEFEKHFPYPASEALYDVAPIDLPGPPSELSPLLVVSVRQERIQPLLDAASLMDIPLSAVEPNSTAIFRATMKGFPLQDKGSLLLVVSSDAIQIVIGYQESCLFYRAVPFAPGAGSVDAIITRLISEIQATVNYIKTLFRHIQIGGIVFAGDRSLKDHVTPRLEQQFQMDVHVADPWNNWSISGAPDEPGDSEAVVGLAVRDMI